MPETPRDRVAEFLAEQTPRRALALAAFVAMLLLFQHLLLLLVFFVAFQRSLAWLLDQLQPRLGWRRGAVLGLILGVAAVAVGLVTWLGAASAIAQVAELRQTLPERIAHWRELPEVQSLQGYMHDTQKLVEGAQHYAAGAVGWLAALGHALVYVVIGLILAVVYTLEQHEITKFSAGLPARSLQGTWVRWLGHTADAVVVTLQLQLVVAVCNAVLTLPLLVFLGIPHIAALTLLIFASSLVPVVGNLLSGAVLSYLAWQTHGWLGVGLLVGLTAVLHKVESYYLNPRLTARHVRLPGFVLILSLLAWEHVLGFVGLFVSFPFLFVAGRIAGEWRAEKTALAAADVGDDLGTA